MLLVVEYVHCYIVSILMLIKSDIVFVLHTQLVVANMMK